MLSVSAGLMSGTQRQPESREAGSFQEELIYSVISHFE